MDSPAIEVCTFLADSQLNSLNYIIYFSSVIIIHNTELIFFYCDFIDFYEDFFILI